MVRTTPTNQLQPHINQLLRMLQSHTNLFLTNLFQEVISQLTINGRREIFFMGLILDSEFCLSFTDLIPITPYELHVLLLDSFNMEPYNVIPPPTCKSSYYTDTSHLSYFWYFRQVYIVWGIGSGHLPKNIAIFTLNQKLLPKTTAPERYLW